MLFLAVVAGAVAAVVVAVVGVRQGEIVVDFLDESLMAYQSFDTPVAFLHFGGPDSMVVAFSMQIITTGLLVIII